MTNQTDPQDKALRILLEALTTISYLKGDGGRASAIAEYALDRYGKALREATAGGEPQPEDGAVSSVGEWPVATPDFPERYFERNRSQCRRHCERRHVDSGLPAGGVERRAIGDRRADRGKR